MAELKKVAVLTFGTLLIVSLGLCSCFARWAEATIIKGIRTGSEQAYVRIVIETDIRLDPHPAISVTRNTMSVSLAGVKKELSDLKSEAYRDDIVNIEVTRTSTQTRIEAILTFAPTQVRTFFLSTPHRFVIDAYRPVTAGTNNPPDETLQPISIIEERGQQSPPETTTDERFSVSNDTNGSTYASFQRRLLIFLIAITSITLIVIIVLMCIDKQRERKSRPPENVNV